MAKPNFDLMLQRFPDHKKYPNLEVLFKHIGGQLARNVGVPGFGPKGNTCAVRMSRAFNYGGMAVSAKQAEALELKTLKGADNLHYLFRVRELNIYLSKTIAVTPQTVSKDFGSAFKGKRGIVSIAVEGWSDASGHVALWDGTAFREPDHDDYRFLMDNPATAVREARTIKLTLWAL